MYCINKHAQQTNMLDSKQHGFMKNWESEIDRSLDILKEKTQ